MKKILILLLFLSSISIAQNDSLEVRLGGFSSNDTAHIFKSIANSKCIVFENNHLVILKNGIEDRHFTVESFVTTIVSTSAKEYVFKS